MTFGFDDIDHGALAGALRDGVSAISVPEPLTLEQWSRQHFYLSAESSYVEQRWDPWPFQRGMMAVIGSDEIREVTIRKSARVGYTKMLLACIGYTAEHLRRNQTLWQPTDDDADDFMKSELDPMLRDVAVMRAVFPAYLARHKDNTLAQKKFIGSILRVRGGKAAKNYRRFSCDRAYLDEVDAFDRDIEKEGDCFTLAGKRIEGATFPKLVGGSTPKLKSYSLIDDRFQHASERFTYHIPCMHCGEFHGITWGGKDIPHGLKWADDQPDTVRHLCPHCASLISQSDYFHQAPLGLWVNEDGRVRFDSNGVFSDRDGNRITPPDHIALHVWTAYSPNVGWSSIVADFLAAHAKMREGDATKMKGWTNTTLGNAWEGELERTDADDLRNRAEPYPLRAMPKGCLLLLCGADTQDNRIELAVWGYGVGGEMWAIDHHVVFGNPATPSLWDEVESFLRGTQYQHASGNPQRIHATAIDSGGHHTDAVYAFAHRCRDIKVHAIKGAARGERSIENGNTKVTYTWAGRAEKNGPTLWMVGTNLAKDRFHSRLGVPSPGPGYVHLSQDCTDEWFKQLAGEDRVTRRLAGGTESRWTPNRTRIEVRDCLAYSIWLEERLDLWHPRKASFWRALEQRVQPDDMIESSSEKAQPEPVEKPRAPDRVVQNPFTRGGHGFGKAAI